MADQLMLNSSLKKVHHSKSDTTKLRLLTEIARETHNSELGLKYNKYILNYINYINDTTYLKYKISSYSHIALIHSKSRDYKKATDNYNEAVKYLRYLNSDELNSIIKEEKWKERKLILIVSIVISIIVGSFFFILYSRYRVIINQKEVIKQQSIDSEKQRQELDIKNKIISRSLTDIEMLNSIGKKITSTMSLEELTEVTFDSIKKLSFFPLFLLDN